MSVLSTSTISNAKGKYKYAKTTVNIRDKPSTDCKVVGQVYWNDRVKIVKRVNKDWYQIKYKKKKRYICSKYLKKKKAKYKTYSSPSNSKFKSYEDASLITNSQDIAQGRLKNEYSLDGKTGVYMVGNRYCIAVGSYYTKRIGVKIDLVLLHRGKKHVLKCITADSKADADTVDNHRVHSDGSVVEFVVNTSILPKRALLMGDISYAGKKFKGKITKIKVYK